MPSGVNTETFTKIMLGPAVLKVAGVVWGVSRGGIRAEIGSTIRNVPFDGKVADIAGMDRVVAYTTRFEGSFLQLGTTDLARLEHGIAAALVGTVNNTTPITAQQMFVTGNYVSNLQFDVLQADGDVVQVEMPLALVEYAIGGGAADDEAAIDISFYCRLDPDTALGLVLTSIVVSPDPVSVDEGADQQFTQAGFDQNLDPIASGGGVWSVIPGTGTGSITVGGLFTGGTAGTVTVRYTVGAVFGEADVTVAAVVLGDVHLQLVADLGGDSVVKALYVTTDGTDGTPWSGIVNSGGMVDQWPDYRGTSGYGPTLIGTGGDRPAWDSGAALVTADSLGDFLHTGLSSVFDPIADTTMVLVGTLEDTYIGSIAESGSTVRLLALRADPPVKVIGSGGVADSGVASSTTRRVALASLNAAGTVWGVEIPDDAKVTSAPGAATGAGTNALTLFGYWNAAGGGGSSLRAVIVMKPEATPAQVAIIKAYGVAEHAAVLV